MWRGQLYWYHLYIEIIRLIFFKIEAELAKNKIKELKE